MIEGGAHFDAIIVGQGLAGTALAWVLRWSGQSVLVIDRNEANTSSKVAAGLMTPITGQKLVISWRYPGLWAFARSFYERVERETSDHFFHLVEMVRLFGNQNEISIFERRLAKGAFQDLIQSTTPNLDPQMLNVQHGGFAMNNGGRLDVLRFLRSSKDVFQRDRSYVEANIDVSREIELTPTEVRIPRFGVVSKRIIFCQGIQAARNPWFRDVVFKPAKGEILSVRIAGLHENRVVHRGVWLAPLGNELFKTGSTYDWKAIDSEPTTSGREEILLRLRLFLNLPIEVVAHSAAVRPIHQNQYPVIGVHPVHSQLGFFNGLGSKGSLHAPFFAQQFANWLLGRGTIDDDVDLNLKTKWKSCDSRIGVHVKRNSSRPLTEQAQDAVRAVVRAGEIVIDATVGNGYDTHFLAELVGNSGTVYGFDIQQRALENTAKRLENESFDHVILLHQDHRDLSNHIPTEAKGKVAAVMFNLGYLPGGHKQIVTQADATVRGIESAAVLLRTGGILTVLVYTGHPGGKDEEAAVSKVLTRMSEAGFEVSTIEGPFGKKPGPILFLVKRR